MTDDIEAGFAEVHQEQSGRSVQAPSGLKVVKPQVKQCDESAMRREWRSVTGVPCLLDAKLDRPGRRSKRRL